MSALYRKYRPKTFEEVVGQNHIKLTLTQEIKSGNIAHAFLFSGPRGIGKTTLARIFARSLNCDNRKDGENEPCNNCRSCLSNLKNNSLNVVEIDAASHTGVENVRQNIIEGARTASPPGKFKVFIIDEVHMLSISAFNALLKTLEEPPERVIFILATTEIHKVPATIISRCQRFDFKKITFNQISERLKQIALSEKVKVDQDVILAVASASRGGMRDAESLFSQVLSLGEKEIDMEKAGLVLPKTDLEKVWQFSSAILAKKASAAIEILNQAEEEGVDIIKFCEQTIIFFRKNLLLKIDANLDKFTEKGNPREEKALLDVAELVNEVELGKIIDILVARYDELKSAFIVSLPLELAIVEICGSSVNAPKVLPRTKIVSVKENPAILASGQEKKQYWPEVVAKIKHEKGSLGSVLEKANLELKGNTLLLTFAYKFHKDLVMNSANREYIQGVIKLVSGRDISINSDVLEDQPQTQDEEGQENDIVDKIKDVFGDNLEG